MDERYQRGKIYTIRCYDDDTMIYVGSTIQPLSKRIGTHRNDSKMEKCKNIMIYKMINENWDNWFIELYENYPCNSKEELEKREGEVQREIGTLNQRIAGRTVKEWYKDSKEKITQYYKDNTERITKRRKEYYENNREVFSEKAKEYRENNKQKLNEKQTQIVVCQYCGCNSMKCNLSRHQKSAKCMKAREST